jgi:hypothetical protein
MAQMRTLLFLAAALTAGLFLSSRINAFLSISIKDKDLGEASSRASRDLPALPFRMVDLGGVGIEADADAWGRDYSHNTRRFDGVFLPGEPFVDAAEADRVFSEFREYADRMSALGFNAIEFQAFLELVDFDRLGSGYDVYPEGSVERKRHEALRAFYSRFFDYANGKGLRVILSTDMVALTPGLRRYLVSLPGGMDVESPEFWSVYSEGLSELFETMPRVDGLMIRIGEAGPLYNRRGWDYTSELMVRSVASVKEMLTSLTKTAEEHGKYIIFRTWSVGVGEVGSMHTDPAVYERILGDIYSDNLIISTKLTKGDFWNSVPYNPTLYSGRHKRIVELQARREFEAFNVIPNYVAPGYQDALLGFIKRNPNIAGVWVWTQAGGPIRQGPMMIYPFAGHWLWTDANVFASAMIAAHPGEPVEKWTREWVRDTFGGGKEVEDGLTELLTLSHGTAVKGLTIPQFARKEVTGAGMEIPPVIYSYWDLMESSTSVMSLVYEASRGELGNAVRDGFAAVSEVRRIKEILASVEGKIEKGREWIPGMEASLDYEENLFSTLAYHKKFMLGFYEWLDKGGGEREAAWKASAAEYKKARASHMERYQGDLDFPAYNFTMADNGVRQAERTDYAVWTSMALLLVLMLFAALVIRKGRDAGSGIGTPLFLSVFTFGVLEAFTSFGAPLFVLTTVVPALIYFLGLRFTVFGPRGGFAYSLLPVLALMGIILTVTSVRGPCYFWYNVWTSGGFRTALASSAVILLLAHFYLVYSYARGTLGAWRLTGRVFFLTGSIVALYGLVYIVFGLDRTLGRLNDEILMMPVMVSRVLGFSTHLDFLVIINEAAVKAGAVLAAAGLLMSGFGRGKRASREVGAAPENISTDNAETVNVPRSE